MGRHTRNRNWHVGKKKEGISVFLPLPAPHLGHASLLGKWERFLRDLDRC